MPPTLGEYTIEITQKGGRISRIATVELKAKQIALRIPTNTKNKELIPLAVNIAFATEKNCPEDIEPQGI